MQKILFTCLMLLCAKFAVAQGPKVTSTINFTGTIGKYPVEMKFNLIQKSDSIFGEYYYVKSGKDSKIFLNGTFRNGKIIAEERAYDSKKQEYLSSGYFNIEVGDSKTISGTWGKSRSEAIKPNALKVKLLGRESLNVFDPLKFKYTISKKRAKYDNISEVAASYYSITALDIDDKINNHQTLIGFNDLDLVDDKGELELEDMNFDGYLDLKILINYPDMTKGDYSYIYYIYDKTQRKFIRNKVLDDIGIAFFDATNQSVVKYDADGRGNEGTITYKWQDEKLHLTKEVRVYEDDIFVHHKEYKVVNGKSVLVKNYKKKE